MTDVDNKIKMVVEGLLLAAGKPLNLDIIAGVFSEDERPDKAELRKVLKAIADDCSNRGFELVEVASGYRFQVKQEVGPWIAKLWDERPPRYSRALLETLALIAYRQPITRGDIEEIRGVSVSPNIIRTLLDREWVRVVGHKDVPGKPALFATSRQFLDYFNLKSIKELPPLAEVRDLAVKTDEFDVEDDLANRNIIELPGEKDLAIEEAELPNEYETLEVEEAVALSKKPLDEILGIEEKNDSDGSTEGIQNGEPDAVSEQENGSSELREAPDSEIQNPSQRPNIRIVHTNKH